MLQTWILRADESSTEAHRSAPTHRSANTARCANHGACGSPLLRKPRPRSARRAPHRSQRPVPEVRTLAEIARAGRGRLIRLGSYSDPAAVPTNVWLALVSRSLRWTGYTHRKLPRQGHRLKLDSVVLGM
jgi:hypothetical protein